MCAASTSDRSESVAAIIGDVDRQSRLPVRGTRLTTLPCSPLSRPLLLQLCRYAPAPKGFGPCTSPAAMLVHGSIRTHRTRLEPGPCTVANAVHRLSRTVFPGMELQPGPAVSRARVVGFDQSFNSLSCVPTLSLRKRNDLAAYSNLTSASHWKTYL